ncbi:AraC family transcriptional regulator [Paenibacillus sp. PR3]|uniref:AraC family transcriptional regulator n=1 Tax=Paenibacillus terricola TaxID=2763503 RepID=A0ABR8MNL8_9BACL|nr:AraC family transcriptional regulator [Paenibacillus terricola]MBD3917597.1 AraC family transcriptional regulator [Paenibacillus terricola]
MGKIEIMLLDQALNRQLDLNLLFHGREECEPLHAWGPGVRDSYIIHYIHSGKGTFRINGESYSLSAKQGFLITPGVIVQYEANKQDPWIYTWLGFRGIQARSFMESAGLDEASPVFRVRDDSIFFETLHDELIAAKSRKSYELMFQSLLYRFLAELMECADAPAIVSSSPSKEAYVRKATEWIEHNYSQKITVRQIADYIGLNRTYLSSLFQEQYGLSLQTYLLHFRMKRAAALLRNRSLSISDVSRSVGYTDPFLFSKMFKKVNGVSPSQSRDDA